MIVMLDFDCKLCRVPTKYQAVCEAEFKPFSEDLCLTHYARSHERAPALLILLMNGWFHISTLRTRRSHAQYREKRAYWVNIKSCVPSFA